MPGGRYDSSKTRVAPLFDRLRAMGSDWPRTLLSLPVGGAEDCPHWRDLDLRFIEGWWGEAERALDPPVSLLSWLIRNPSQWASVPDSPERERLARGDPDTVAVALDSLRAGSTLREWFVLEGRTVPDAFIETPDALIIVEGKRTEAGPTTSTKWLRARHQMWRHIDAAWERAGRRRVFGLFAVEGGAERPPVEWLEACRELLSPPVIAGSFPHRSDSEIAGIRQCFLGVTTWRRVCAECGVPFAELPNEVP